MTRAELTLMNRARTAQTNKLYLVDKEYYIGTPEGMAVFYPTVPITAQANASGQVASINASNQVINSIPPYPTTIVPTDTEGNTILGVVSETNSSTAILESGATFTGTAELNNYPDVFITVKTNQTGTIYADFSPDGTNWDSTLSFEYNPSLLNPPHVLVKGSRYFRIRYINTGSTQEYFRLFCYYGSFNKLTSPANAVIARTQDALVIRPLDFNLTVAEGLYQNTQNTIKDGINPDVRSGSVPEDVWYSGGTYPGFPTGSVEAAEMVVAGADTGTVYYSYLASPTSTDYVFGSKAIAGAATYALGHNIWRCNFAYFVSSSATGFNAGDITIRNTPTTANIFVTIPAGFSQSYTAAYTVPYGSSIYMDRITSMVRGSTSTSMDGFFWYRPYGESPRLRFPFEVQFGQLYFDDIDYLVKIPERTDIIPRITVSSSASASEVEVTYRFLKIKT